MRPSHLAAAAALACVAAGWSAAPAQAASFPWALLPAEQSCLERVEEVDTELCMMKFVQSPLAGDCLRRGGGLAMGNKAVCWTPAGPRAGGERLPQTPTRASARCLADKQGVVLRDGKLVCLALPREISDELFPVGASLGTKRVGVIPQTGIGPTFPGPASTAKPGPGCIKGATPDPLCGSAR